ncbi:MAG: DUF3021 domain-containing protein [Oscillospiraceae bacterium]|nr:DUF3021 domain-containing protein [Oscillospiraceae bacterium]
MSKMRNFLEQYITRKIGAEIKCCLTFLLILCFYCVYRWGNGFTEAGIIHMLEMVWAAYILEWVQMLVHCDFDEADRLGLREWIMIVCGSAVYAVAGHLFGWFDGNTAVVLGFGAYMIVAYLCTFWVYAIKRSIDAKMLNSDLKKFQERNNK